MSKKVASFFGGKIAVAGWHQS